MDNKITILTAIKNSEKEISHLVNSINNQTNKEFTWLIIDGMSLDKGIEIIRENCIANYEIISANDFSIYDALNIGIKHIKTEYYVTAGSDDFFHDDFINFFYKIIKEKSYDLIFGKVETTKKIISSKTKKIWYCGVEPSHSIGTIIKTSLHSEYGYYSNQYPIVADRLFIRQIEISNKKEIHSSDYVFGNYSITGYSSRDSISSSIDLFKMQVATGQNFYLQFLLLIARLLKSRI